MNIWGNNGGRKKHHPSVLCTRLERHISIIITMSDYTMAKTELLTDSRKAPVTPFTQANISLQQKIQCHRNGVLFGLFQVDILSMVL